MKLYGAAQAGLQAVSPGDRITLFDGTEAPAAGITSAAFVRAPGPLQMPGQMVFTCHFPLDPPVDATILIQASNRDVEAEYQTVFTKTATQDSYYQDAGNFTFYRAKLSAYVAGGMPIVTAKR